MLTTLKKYPKSAIALLLLGAILVYSYSWTYTPHGRLDYMTALSLHLLTFERKHQPDPNHELVLNMPINLAFSTSSILPVDPVAKTEDISIPGSEATIPARVYWPNADQAGAPLPVIVYFHGGGFMLGSVEIFDHLARSLSRSNTAVVVSVDYRLTPAHPYPAALTDCYDAVQWVAKNAESLGADASRLIIAGDSAGGNLAAAIALKASNEQGPNIAAQLLYYPVVDLTDKNYPSYDKFTDGYGASREMSQAFHNAYIGHVTDKSHPYISPLYAETLAGLPPALVATAGFDRLTDPTRLYIDRLKQAGVEVKALSFPEAIHGFLSVPIFSQREESLLATQQFLADVL